MEVHTNHLDIYTFKNRRTEKTLNLLHELDQKFLEWKINEKNTENEESCPVCYEPIQSSNYITPKCGHKLCLQCYKQCILSRGNVQINVVFVTTNTLKILQYITNT